MRVHENVALNPCIGAIEIQMIVSRPIENIADNLQDRSGTLATRKIDRVVEAPRVPKIIITENAVAADGDSIHAVQHLRSSRGGISRERAILNDER
jgi:hypothetical protein